MTDINRKIYFESALCIDFAVMIFLERNTIVCCCADFAEILKIMGI